MRDEVEIQGSDKTLISVPSPIALPRFEISKSRPAKIPVHPWDEDFEGWTLSRDVLWQYFPSRTRASKQFGLVSIRHGSFASKAVLKAWISLNPSPHIPLGLVSVSQDTQHIFFLPVFESHQNRVSADWIILQRPTGSWKHVIAKEGITDSTALSIVIFPAEDRHRVDHDTALIFILHCSFAKRVWNLISISAVFDPEQFSSFISAVENTSSWICLPPCGIQGDLFSWVCWNLWITRNQLLFESRPASVQSLSQKLLLAPENRHMHMILVWTCQRILRWPQFIPIDTVTCNTDAAWKKETSNAGLAWIFDSSSPLIVSDGCKFQNRVPYALMAEGLAVREALSHARHLGITKIWLRSDSLSLVKAIHSVAKPMNLYGVLSDIESLSSSFSFCCISFIPREGNGLADNLSKACLSHVLTTWASGHFILWKFQLFKKKREWSTMQKG